MRKLAIDYGTNRVGFAISDPDNLISIPYEVLNIKNNDFLYIIEFIKNLLKTIQIDAIILGYPLRSDNSKSERTIKVEHFKKYLEKNFDLPIILINEYGSSIRANQILISGGFTRSKRKNVVDKIAAQIILEEYLNYHYKNKDCKKMI